ncbi:hypothetical protein HZC53_05005 [Candidatus Uhrbacteria bacterium]|nr:hypothetical protein [Candidatus Uhrbacteria bacterium]
MNLTQKLTIAAIALSGTAALGTSVYAAQLSPAVHNRMGDIVQAIATKFNLNKDDVQKVFDEQRAANQAEMQAKGEQRFTDMLTKAVADGKLTQTQADLIKAKHEEVQTFMQSLKDKTPEERQAAMKNQADSLKRWAKDNGIPAGYLPMGFGMGGERGGFMGRGMGKMRGGQGFGAERINAAQR